VALMSVPPLMPSKPPLVTTVTLAMPPENTF
jgi:hypothetical protein